MTAFAAAVVAAAAPLRRAGGRQPAAAAAALPRCIAPASSSGSRSSGSSTARRARSPLSCGTGSSTEPCWPVAGRSAASSAWRWRRRGFVGEGSRPAGEYHSADFAWEELVPAGEAALARQIAEREAHLAAAATDGAAAAAAAAGGAAGPAGTDEGGGAAGNSWERFHAQHSAARFFKEKR